MPLVHEFREVLAGGAPPALVALGDRLGPGGVQTDLVTLTYRLEIRALARSIRLGRPDSEGGAIARSSLIACRLCQPRRASCLPPSGVRP